MVTLNKLFNEAKNVEVDSLVVDRIDTLQRKLNLPSRGMVVERAIELLEKHLK
jgi:hypothetical protein